MSLQLHIRLINHTSSAVNLMNLCLRSFLSVQTYPGCVPESGYGCDSAGKRIWSADVPAAQWDDGPVTAGRSTHLALQRHAPEHRASWIEASVVTFMTQQGTLLCLSERPQMLFYSSFLLEEFLICFQGNNICLLNMDCSIFGLLLSETVSSWGSIFILKALKKLSSVGNLDCHMVCNFNLGGGKSWRLTI